MKSNVYIHLRSIINEVVADKSYFLTEDKWESIEELIQKEEFKYLLGNISSLILIYNIKTGFYEFASDNFKTHMGYEPDLLIGEKGAHFIYSLLPEEQANLFAEVLMKNIFGYIFQHSTPDTGRDYRFTCSLKFKDIQGKTEWYLVDTSILQVDEMGLPVRTIITCTNIHQFKKDEVIYYDVLLKNEDGLFKPVLQSSVNSDQHHINLTEREYEIARMICKGYTNPKIAKELFISLNTVQTHRKNIMKKTQCKGTGELINYGYARGIV